MPTTPEVKKSASPVKKAEPVKIEEVPVVEKVKEVKKAEPKVKEVTEKLEVKKEEVKKEEPKVEKKEETPESNALIAALSELDAYVTTQKYKGNLFYKKNSYKDAIKAFSDGYNSYAQSDIPSAQMTESLKTKIM